MHESTRHSPKMLEIISHSGPNISFISKHLISSGFSSCYSRLTGDEPSVTITVNFVHPASNRCIHPVADRGLTPCVPTQGLLSRLASVRAIRFTRLVLPMPGAPEIRSLSGWLGAALSRSAIRNSTSATFPARPTKSAMPVRIFQQNSNEITWQSRADGYFRA